MTRKCGTCSACCRWPSIAELDKPARVDCSHLHKRKFCKIYKTRPEICAEYHCSWIRGIGAKRDQPDICGVLIDRRSTQFGIVLVAKSLTPNAAMSKAGKLAIQRATKGDNLYCLVIDDDENIIGAAGPDDFMKEVHEQILKGNNKQGNQKDWITNITTAAMKGVVYPGLDHGG